MEIHFILLLCIINISICANDCKNIEVKPFISNPIKIAKEDNESKCVYFSYDNPLEGDVMLKFIKGNSYSSLIYVYENKSEINSNFENYLYKFQLGLDFFQEKKIENLKIKTYYLVIYEPYYTFNDILIIYNNNFSVENKYYYELSSDNDNILLNFKNKYTEDNPLLLHYKNDKANYLNFQFINIAKEIIIFEIFENEINDKNLLSKCEGKSESGDYVEISPKNDYYVKIITNSEINIYLSFSINIFIELTPNSSYRNVFLTYNNLFYYIENPNKENISYYELTLKLDEKNKKNLPFDILINSCNEKSDDQLNACITNSKKAIIKRDNEVPYYYHIYYSFNNKRYVVLQIKTKNEKPDFSFEQMIILQNNDGIYYINENKNNFFYNNITSYYTPVYFNISLNKINDEGNINKNKLLLIYSNCTNSIKIFYGNNILNSDNIETYYDMKLNKEITVFDFNNNDFKKQIGNDKFFIVMLYNPWVLNIIKFELIYINNNENTIYKIIDNKSEFHTLINLDIPGQRLYLFSLYDIYKKNILYNEMIYGKIKAYYKFKPTKQELYEFIHEDSGYIFSSWTSIQGNIYRIIINCISPALFNLHLISYELPSTNLDLGKTYWLYITMGKELKLKLPESKEIINFEAEIVSNRLNQEIQIEINNDINQINMEKGKNLIRKKIDPNLNNNIIIKGIDEQSLVRIKLGISSKNINKTYYYLDEYEKDEIMKVSKNKVYLIENNNNNKNINLCYSANYADKDIITFPYNENCFNLNSRKSTNIMLLNPWIKYLNISNKLYQDEDSFYFILQVNETIDNIKIVKKEEEVNVGYTYLEPNKIWNITELKNIGLYSSLKEENVFLIQIYPSSRIIDKNNINKDHYKISTFIGNDYTEGILYNKNNRTFIFINDSLVNIFIDLSKSRTNYEYKYSILDKNNTDINIKFNDNYTLELINNKTNNNYVLKFRPLIKDYSINYRIYLSRDVNKNFASILYLENEVFEEEQMTYIFYLDKKTNDDFILYNLPNIVNEIIENYKWVINVLTKERKIHNISMNYDVIYGGENKKSDTKEEIEEEIEEEKEQENEVEKELEKDQEEEEEKEKGNDKENRSSHTWIIILIIIIIAVSVGIGVFIYWYKKKHGETLLDKVQKLNLSMDSM